MKWKIKTILENSNVGDQIKKARIAKGFTINKIHTTYHIPITFLEAVEQNNFEALPDTVYTKAMLKKYLKILELPLNQYITFQEEAQTHWKALKSNMPTKREVKRAKKSYSRFSITPSFFQKGFVVALSAFLLIYIGMRVDAAIAPTKLIVITPQDQTTTEDSSIMVTGQTEDEALLKINRFDVLVSEDGSFQESIDLRPGLNILEIEATKKYRPSQTIIRHILVIKP